jgi:hypothetical protein
MQYQTPLNEFHPLIQNVLRQFARKSHGVNLIVKGDNYLDTFRRAIFIDPRFPKRDDSKKGVGYVSIYMDNDEVIYKVRSRLIQNEKFRRESEDYYTKTSKNVDKIVKATVSYIRQFNSNEMFEFNRELIKDMLSGWRSELYKPGMGVWERVCSDQVFEEVEYLRNIGVQFKTDVFRELASQVEARYEHKRRAQQHVDVYHVFITENRVMMTVKTADHFNHHKNSPKQMEIFNSIEELPEELLANVSLLKILGGDSKMIDGVGCRVSDREFLVMKPLATGSNA